MLNPGDIVDNRFEVLALIGQGGLAEVFRVRHMELGSEYALKLLTWRREKLAERMVLEGRIQAQLKHPNVVSVVDLVRHEGQVGLLMEFVDGDTLEATILAGPTPVEASLRLFSGVLAAVDAAHNAGVLHRDLKPANIMLARSGSTLTPKVADFGLAKVVLETASGMTKVGMTMGTPGYLAPEQLSDASTAGKQADVFALGIILYELLTGTRAYDIIDGMVAVHATANEVPTPLNELRPDIPLAICTVVQRATDRDPAKRLQSCAEFAALLYRDHPILLEQFSDSVHGMPISLSLASPSFTASSGSKTYRDLETAVPPVEKEAEPQKRRVGLWIGIAAAGLLLSLTAMAAVAWVSLSETQSGPAITPVVSVPQISPVDADTEPDTQAELDAVVDAELPADIEAAVAEPVEPSPRREQSQPVRVQPIERDTEADIQAQEREEPDTEREEPDTEREEPDAEREEPDAEPEEPDAEPEEPDAEPIRAVMAVTAPVPQPVALLQLQGDWSGTAGRQRMTLSLDSSSNGSIRGRMTVSLGPTVRTESVSGTLAPGGAITFTAGDFLFSGRATNSRLWGSYSSGGRDRNLDWSATR
jgi:serine/threonine protein kinase